ncbi:MAG TPA: sensor histidine kinase [Candidatus Acidoferrales bacterium]|nr:sensor histidine kinase [Candidatus Acidoferrales bacterium]
MRLLPPDRETGWTPYVWLIYLAIYYFPLAVGRVHWGQWAMAAVVTAVFLPLYFLGYWLRGLRCLWAIGGITLLGVVLSPSNPGACVFFVYAAAFAGYAGSTATGLKILGSILAIIGGETLVFHLSPWFWADAVVFSLLIGSVNIHYGQVKQANRRLRLAHEEIEHLAKVAERERIARDMHDILGHTLSVVILKSELASKLFGHDPRRARAEIGDIERISREALAEVRNAIGGYRAGSLAAELARAETTLRTAGVSVQSQWTPPPLSPAQETVLSLALREAATNIVRHARARHCRLALSQADGCCRLEIQDDGRGGFTLEGHGLRGMRERVEALGGTLERDTSQGTRLAISVPVPNPGASAAP